MLIVARGPVGPLHCMSPAGPHLGEGDGPRNQSFVACVLAGIKHQTISKNSCSEAAVRGEPARSSGAIARTLWPEKPALNLARRTNSTRTSTSMATACSWRAACRRSSTRFSTQLHAAVGSSRQRARGCAPQRPAEISTTRRPERMQRNRMTRRVFLLLDQEARASELRRASGIRRHYSLCPFSTTLADFSGGGIPKSLFL